MQGPGSMMLRDKVSDPLRQTDLLRQLQPVGNMAGNDLRARRGPQAIVRIAPNLVLYKVIGRRHFANIVVKRSDAGQQRVCTDGAAGVLSQLPDRMRMLICSRRPQS